MKNRYSAITIVSPMFSDCEFKDQDRARWHEPCQVACICDGVSSSPYADKAAEIVTSLIPSVFDNNPITKLEMIADTLLKYRLEASEETPIIEDNKYSSGMKKILSTILKQKNSSSYQTTVMSVKLSDGKNAITAQILKCGDSAFFAFSEDGSLLSSSLQFNKNFAPIEKSQKQILFGPKDQILVKVEGRLSKHNEFVQKSGIKPEFTNRWILCTPIDSHVGKYSCENNLLEIKPLHLTANDKLIIPEYLYGARYVCQDNHYRVMDFSSSIRVLTPDIDDLSTGFKNKSSATRVFPDHFYSGDFDFFKDSFPPGTNFLLCSDGFYSAFDDFSELFAWLKGNQDKFNNPIEKEKVMHKLHLQLNQKTGDDDISFILATPKEDDNVL